MVFSNEDYCIVLNYEFLLNDFGQMFDVVRRCPTIDFILNSACSWR